MLDRLSASQPHTITSRSVFPGLLASSFHEGIVRCFGFVAAACLEGGRYIEESDRPRPRLNRHPSPGPSTPGTIGLLSTLGSGGLRKGLDARPSRTTRACGEGRPRVPRKEGRSALSLKLRGGHAEVGVSGAVWIYPPRRSGDTVILRMIHLGLAKSDIAPDERATASAPASPNRARPVR